MDAIIVREATAADVDAIGDLWAELVAYHRAIDAAMPRANTIGAKSYARRIRDQIEDRYCAVFVAEHDGRVVGFVVGVIVDLMPDVFEPETNGFLADIFVQADFRRGGVGWRLVNALMAWFKSRGVLHMEWYVAARNEAGRAFWQAVGGRDVMVRMRSEL